MCEEFRTCKTHALSVYLLLLAGCVIPLFLPVGIVIALIGGPFFMYLFIKPLKSR